MAMATYGWSGTHSADETTTRQPAKSPAMGDEDVFASSTAALSFERFIGKINQESARDLVKHINM